MCSVFAEFIDEMCFIYSYDIPEITGVEGGDVCVVTDIQTCAKVNLTATKFYVNPSFSCRVTVRVGKRMTHMNTYNTYTVIHL